MNKIITKIIGGLFLQTTVITSCDKINKGVPPDTVLHKPDVPVTVKLGQLS